jgi:CRISPR system Cascade subunit CasD
MRADELDGDTKTTITHREYRVDALHTVALWNRAKCPWNLDQIRAALRRPHWVLYLGRRCCLPALPLNPIIVDAENIPEAFALRPPLAKEIAGHLPIQLDRYPIIAADVGAPGVVASRVEQRRDGYHYTSGDLRTFVERQEWIMEVPMRDEPSVEEAN